MPIYEYECAACRKSFEKLERTMSAASDTAAAKGDKCPSCGSTKTKRKLSAFAAVAGGKQQGGTATKIPHPGCHCGGGGCG